MKVLAIVAHADDEVLGCGGTLARHAAEGDEVRVLEPFTNGVGSRLPAIVTLPDRPGPFCPDYEEEAERRLLRDGTALARHREWLSSLDELGAMFLDIDMPRFPDQRLGTVPMLALARCVETALDEFPADLVITHHLGDLNQDHRCVAEAVLIATRPASGSTVSRVIACEIPETTSQAFGGLPFAPNLFVDISASLKAKLRALRCYESERRESPHPRSDQGVVTHAGYRGGAAGVDFAEAFMIVREVRR